VVLLATAYTATLRAPRKTRAEGADVRPGRGWLIAQAAGSALVLALAAWMAALLAAHFSENGRAETRRHLKSAITKESLVIDKTGYRVAFLKEPYIVKRPAFSRDRRLAEDPFTARFPRREALSPLWPNRVLAVERHRLFDPQRAIYLGKGRGGGPYELKETRQFGRYAVHHLEKRPGLNEVGRLSDEIGSLAVSAVTKEKTFKGQYSPTMWTFKGRSRRDSVERRTCRIARLPREMLSAPPLEKATLRIAYEVPTAAKWVTVYGGLTDRSAAWHRSDISMVIKFSGQKIVQRHIFPNRPGITGTTVAIPKESRKVTFEIRAENPLKRPFCFDAVFSADGR
jgi:hypothetical protein